MAELDLLSVAEMGEADRRTIAGGTPGIFLMECAGAAVADAAQRWPGAVLVLAGPGNNGGDGFVAARLLAGEGRPVTIALLGDRAALTGDAAQAAAAWTGPVVPLEAADFAAADLVVDAIFGAGLSRPVDGAAAEALGKAEASGLPVLAVDVPSGVDGDSGAVRGRSIRASLTVTFARKKPGHLLLPGRELCGEVVLADIGIPEAVVEAIGPTAFTNRPALWRDDLPRLRVDGHKYGRGHALVLAGGIEGCGAARLAARAALRAGAGLVTLGAPAEALVAHAAALEAVMLRRADGVEGVAKLLEDTRRNAVVLGPALGVGEETAKKVARVLAAARPAVLDADALTSFSSRAKDLAALIFAQPRPVVLTPHDGEFVRLFDGMPEVFQPASKLERTRRAAAATGAVVVLKGPDTVVATPDGRASIADNAPPWLATAGAGDVLSGMIGGLLAQGMPAFEAASVAVWMHGAAAARFGPGLISEDLPDLLPPVLAELLGHP